MKVLLIVFPLVFLSLISAVWSGWIRIGWNLPVNAAAAQHGALMVNSFLASLIFLERAVTFKSKWVLLVPLINASSVIAFLTDHPVIAQWLFICGSAGFVMICFYFTWKFNHLYYFVFLAGAFCLLCGNIILYKTNFYPSSFNWWMGFLLFTIVAERLELSRFLKLTQFKRSLLLFCLAGTLGAFFWPFHKNGGIALSLAVAATALWLLKYDMARYSIKISGQHRYSGLLLIAGYIWLLIMALLLLFQGRLPFGYDAVLHSFFIGFVFSMIFSHAPIIIPAIAGMPVKIYRPILYLWFILLQLGLVIRIVGDVTGNLLLRKYGGISNGVVILLFFVCVAMIMISESGKYRFAKTKK